MATNARLSWFMVSSQEPWQPRGSLTRGAGEDARTQRPSCALVTSGSNILKTGWGGAIDAHDVVVRLNNAPSKKFEKDVGSRTDLRYTNGYYEGSRDSKLEAVIAGKWCPKARALTCPCFGRVRTMSDERF